MELSGVRYYPKIVFGFVSFLFNKHLLSTYVLQTDVGSADNT